MPVESTIVVADTSPLNYLILINEDTVLPHLFRRVLVPDAVITELSNPRTPAEVRGWIAQPPRWLEVHVGRITPRPELDSLDPGEREAIELALQWEISTVLMDELEGRRLAKGFHLNVCGTLGVLERAARLGKTDLASALSRLDATNFRLSPPRFAWQP